jgi:hypothetical protein
MASNTAAELRKFLRDSSARKFDWVTCNCGFWVCEWIEMMTGEDPVADTRGRFKTVSGFVRHVASSGGNEEFSRQVAKRARLVETDAPIFGDVGLVATGDGATMAIKVDAERWACKTSYGIAIGPFEQITAWRL